MRLHDKVGRLRALRPDVAIVPECACPEVLLRRAPDLEARDFAWDGAIPRKGLAVLAFGPFGLEIDRAHRPRSGTTLPVRVTGPVSFRLVAVWDLPGWGHRPWGPPPEPLPDGLERLSGFLASPPAIVAGDFNKSLLARRSDRRAVPSRLALRLTSLGFSSAYHLARGVEHGGEAEPTFFLHRRLPGRHHADHVFLDTATSSGLRRVEVGAGRRWVPSSDHVPVVVEIELVAAPSGRPGGCDGAGPLRLASAPAPPGCCGSSRGRLPAPGRQGKATPIETGPAPPEGSHSL